MTKKKRREEKKDNNLTLIVLVVIGIFLVSNINADPTGAFSWGGGWSKFLSKYINKVPTQSTPTPIKPPTSPTAPTNLPQAPTTQPTTPTYTLPQAPSAPTGPATAPVPPPPPPTESHLAGNCADGKDNDADGKIDCMDSGCFGQPSCPTEHSNILSSSFSLYVMTNNAYNPQYNQNIQLCSDGSDNDNDGLVDCQDPDCFNTCDEGPTGFLRTTLSGATCLDKLDNDLDGSTDLIDPSCNFFSMENNGAGCYDWLDNDQNGLIDCADPSCSNNPICSEGQFGMMGSCFDWLDNDNNGITDCNDINCINAGVCGPTETGHCMDYLDNDNDGAVDCVDSDCGNDPLCSACFDSDSGFSAGQLGRVTLGGMALYLGHDECIYTQYGTTPTLLHEKACPVGTLYGIPAARLINCTTIGFTKCQNGRCV